MQSEKINLFLIIIRKFPNKAFFFFDYIYKHVRNFFLLSFFFKLLALPVATSQMLSDPLNRKTIPWGYKKLENQDLTTWIVIAWHIIRFLFISIIGKRSKNYWFNSNIFLRDLFSECNICNEEFCSKIIFYLETQEVHLKLNN